MTTRTGNFAIGFRRGGSEWQKNLPVLAAWAAQQGFEALDLREPNAADLAALAERKLRVGSVDFIHAGKVVSKDPAERKDHVARGIEYIRQCAAAGCRIIFTVIPASDSTARASANYAVAVESFAPLAAAAHEAGAVIAVEGWPGGRPAYANLVCNPEQYRAFLKDCGAGVAINFDPSHLIRMGIDPMRFLGEFAPRVRHVHGKDTQIVAENIYELGLYQESISRKGFGYGEWAWRYTIPGHGVARWPEMLSVLKQAGFAGIVSVELEDCNFNGTEEGEKAGLVHSLNFLRGA
jgi:sugar phosphate isomerase/epimerase